MTKHRDNSKAIARATGPKPEYNATNVLNDANLSAAHGAANQPLDKQVEQVKHSIASIETDLDKAVRKGQHERRNRLASLLSSQRATLAHLLDRLAAAPGFAPGTSYKPKRQDHASFHPGGVKPEASKVRKVRASAATKARYLAAITEESERNEIRHKLGKPKGSKP